MNLTSFDQEKGMKYSALQKISCGITTEAKLTHYSIFKFHFMILYLQRHLYQLFHMLDAHARC